MIEAGMNRMAKLPIKGNRTKAIIWMTNMLKKAKGRPIVSESQPQKSRPAPLKMEIVMTSADATPAATWVNDCASGEATEMRAAPAVTLRARMSQSRYQRGE